MRTLRLIVILALGVLGCRPSAGTEVHFESGGATLAGTLLRPEAKGPIPAVVLIHGSGETDRSTSSYYAGIFVENGYAALIYDKRGVGESGGDPDFWKRFDFDTLAADAAAAVEFLARRPGIDPDRIGLFGASQGGWVAPLAAHKAPRVTFMVLLSPSVTSVAEDRLFERAARLRQEGFTDEEIRQVTAVQRIDQEVTRSGEGFDKFAGLWAEHENARWFRRVYLGEEPLPADHEWRRWYRTILDYDPVPLLAELDIPALWLFGDPDLDRFGPVQTSMQTLERLRELGKEYEVQMYPGADHNLWNESEERDAPYRSRIGAWLGALSQKEGR